MLIIAPGHLNPELVHEIRRFRERIYAEDEVWVSDEPDEKSYHVALYVEGHLAGCLRYTPLPDGETARIGGWCVASRYRHTRVALDLAREPFRLARILGHSQGVAYATTRHGSARILRKLGGRVVATYWDSEYRCEMQRLEFRIARLNGAESQAPDSIAA